MSPQLCMPLVTPGQSSVEPGGSDIRNTLIQRSISAFATDRARNSPSCSLCLVGPSTEAIPVNCVENSAPRCSHAMTLSNSPWPSEVRLFLNFVSSATSAAGWSA